MISELIVHAPDGSFDGESREVKGDLVAWKTLCEWLVVASPPAAGAGAAAVAAEAAEAAATTMEPCAFAEWQQEGGRVAALSEDEARADGLPSSAVASAKRTLMLLPAIEQEFAAEERRRIAGEGADGRLVIDAAWGARFGSALVQEFASAK